MNFRIDAVHIAGRALCAKGLRFENIDAVLPPGYMRSVKSQSEFKRHVESRHTLGQFDAGKIVDRIRGFFNQFDDRVKPPLIWNRKRETELRKANDISEIQILEAGIVRNIYKNRLNLSCSWHVWLEIERTLRLALRRSFSSWIWTQSSWRKTRPSDGPAHS